MQQSSEKMKLWSRINAGLTLVLCFVTFISPAFAQESVPIAAAPFLIAMADPPDFLSCPLPGKEAAEEKEREGAITPFIDTRQVLTLLPTPERPAIDATEVISQDRPEVTAGVNVDLGTVKFDIGYTLPSSKVDNLVRPFGVDLEPGSDCKRFSLGVKIPF